MCIVIIIIIIDTIIIIATTNNNNNNNYSNNHNVHNAMTPSDRSQTGYSLQGGAVGGGCSGLG